MLFPFSILQNFSFSLHLLSFELSIMYVCLSSMFVEWEVNFNHYFHNFRWQHLSVLFTIACNVDNVHAGASYLYDSFFCFAHLKLVNASKFGRIMFYLASKVERYKIDFKFALNVLFVRV